MYRYKDVPITEFPVSTNVDLSGLTAKQPWIKQDLLGNWHGGSGKEPGLLDGYKDPEAAELFGKAQSFVDDLRANQARRAQEIKTETWKPDLQQANGAFAQVYQQLMRRGLI